MTHDKLYDCIIFKHFKWFIVLYYIVKQTISLLYFKYVTLLISKNHNSFGKKTKQKITKYPHDYVFPVVIIIY